MPPMAHYFAYGARMSSSEMLKDSTAARPAGPARLDGYRLEFNVRSRDFGGGAANAIPDPEGCIWGVLWEVPEEDMEHFGSYRGGDPASSHAVDVQVTGPDGPTTARTLMIDSQAGFVRPSESYLRLLHAAISAHGLPEEAGKAVDRADQLPDPPTPTI
jgi:hypothetical protein